MKLEILPSAWDDLADGFWFYEARSAGLGDKFREALIADIETLQRMAGIHRIIWGHHRALARRFPFAIYYSVANEIVTVRAVLDCRRAPDFLRQKLP
jgi:hypothetical protein